ncbi:MAG: thioredoxin family protein [Bacteroidales bacterium]
MKNFLVFTLCALFALTSFAQTEGVNFEHGTLQEALNKAKANKKGPKLVFLDCYTTWCGPCKHMANTVFPTKAAGDYFNKNFVNIKIDMEKGEGLELAKKYSVAAYPTFLILNIDGGEVGRVVGGGDLNEFIKKVELAKDVNNSPKHLKDIYETDKTVENALAYLKCLENAYMKEDMAKFIGENLTIFKKAEVFSPQMWIYFSQNLAGNNPALLKYLLDNKITANAYIGKDVVDNTIVSAYYQSLMMYLMGRKELTKEEINVAANTITLLSKSSDKAQLMCANVAILYANKNMEEIGKLYKFMNYTSYGIYELQGIERVFGSLKEITKEQIEQYYKDKADFYTKQAEGCKGWKEMFIKGK